MIRLVRSMQIANRKAAIKWSTVITGYVADKYHENNVHALIDSVSNNGRRISWHIDFDCPAEWKKWRTELVNDKRYLELISRAAASGAFAENTQTDSFLQSY